MRLGEPGIETLQLRSFLACESLGHFLVFRFELLLGLLVLSVSLFLRLRLFLLLCLRLRFCGLFVCGGAVLAGGFGLCSLRVRFRLLGLCVCCGGVFRRGLGLCGLRDAWSACL